MSPRTREPIELLTAAHIAQILGVSVRRAQQIAERPDFPTPFAITPPRGSASGMRLWTRDDVEHFRATTNRTRFQPWTEVAA